MLAEEIFILGAFQETAIVLVPAGDAVDLSRRGPIIGPGTFAQAAAACGAAAGILQGKRIGIVLVSFHFTED